MSKLEEIADNALTISAKLSREGDFDPSSGASDCAIGKVYFSATDGLAYFDINEKKIVRAVTPLGNYTNVVDISKRIFCVGTPYQGNNQEFIESSKTLVSKAPLLFRKGYFPLVILSASTFITLGGYNESGSYLKNCEIYDIKKDKWEEAPSLTLAKYCAAGALLNGRKLLCIGGDGNERSGEALIECLDLRKKSEGWKLLTMKVNEATRFTQGPSAFQLSPHEILILAGGNTTDAFIYSDKTEEIKRSVNLPIADQFYSWTPRKFKNFMYLPSIAGRLFVYNIKERKWETSYQLSSTKFKH
eukprot:TRINITY_DN527_c0_g1_i2.p1 TRINITY_DN527_c0_g1~~TRINITY_DN527_c0_g1_i2.p1  ORF type:complete len:302 (+),score=48.12 TRINITY_DN527_c0_g1_i2:624-1529(+)